MKRPDWQCWKTKLFAGWGEARELFPCSRKALKALGGDFPSCTQVQPVSFISLLEHGNSGRRGRVFWVFLLCSGCEKICSVHTPVEHFLSCVARSDTRATLPVNDFWKELLIINAESSKREGKQRFPARTFDESAIKAISPHGAQWAGRKPFRLFILCWEFSAFFGCISPGDGPAAPRGARRMLPDSGELAERGEGV